MKSFRRVLPFFALIAACLLASALPLSAATPAAADGADLFKGHKCVMCHGMDGKGFSAIHTPDFTSPKWQAGITDEKIADTIKSGKPNTMMKANGGGPELSESEIQALVKYIRSLNSEKKN